MLIPTFDTSKNKKILQKKMIFMSFESTIVFLLTLLHSERPKLYTILAFLSAVGFMSKQKSVKCMSAFHFLFQVKSLTKMEKKKV